MSRLRAMTKALSPGFFILATGFALLLGFMTYQGTIGSINHTRTCLAEIDAAEAAMAAGATEYQGSCIGFFDVGDEPGHFFESHRAMYQEMEEEELARLSEDYWGVISRSLGSFAIVVFAALLGANVAGSPLGSGTAAWSMSNGWTRRTWIKTVLAFVLVGIFLAQLVFTVGFGVAGIIQVGASGTPIDLTMPGWTALSPLPGLIFFGMLAAGLGILLNRGELVGMLALGVIVGDTILSGYTGFEYTPWPLHASAVATSTETDPWLAAGILLAYSIVLGSVLYWYFVQRKDIPDR